MKSRWVGLLTGAVLVLYAVLFLPGLFLPDDKSAERSVERQKQAETLLQKEETARKNLEQKPETATAVSLAFTVVFFWGLALNLRLLSRWSRGRPPEGPRPAPVLWGGRDVFGAFMFLLFTEACLFFLQSALRLVLGYESKTPDAVLLLTSFARGLFVAFFVWMLVKNEYGQGLREMGMRFGGFFSHVRRGIAGWVAMVPSLVLVFLAVGAVLKFFSVQPAPQSVVQMYLEESSSGYLIPLTLFVAAAGPVMEELFFRGFAYAGLRRRFGVAGAVVLSSAAFAALHMHWVSFVPVFLLGAFLACLYEFSGSLVPCIAAHALHNTVMVALTLAFKGLSSS